MASLTYKCPNCGAPLTYQPGKDKSACYSGQGGGRGGFIDDNRLGRNFTEPSDPSFSPGRTGLLTPMHGIWREFDMAFRAVETKGQGKTLEIGRAHV